MTRVNFRRDTRGIITLIFVVACLTCLLCIIGARARNVIVAKDVSDLLTYLAEVYSLPVGATVGSLLATKGSRTSGPKWALMMIAAMVFAWNAVIVWYFATLPITQQYKPDEIGDFCGLLARRWSFLIVGGIAYVTGKSVRDAT